MRETIHNAATLGMDFFVVTLLAIAALYITIYLGYFLFRLLIELFGEVRKP
jgi:hypothetical protein